MAGPNPERCAGITTPGSSWPTYGRKPRRTPCTRPVAFVVEDGGRALNACTAHLGGIANAAATRVRRGPASVWTVAAWRGEIEA